MTHKVSIEFSFTELDYIVGLIGYLFDHLRHEGIDYERWGNPKILNKIRTKAEKALKEFD